MPDVDGVRVLQQLVEEGDGSPSVPVIVITGSSDAAAEAGRIIGRGDVFEKPFDPDDLIARMRTRLGED